MKADVVVAGHACLDVIPAFPNEGVDLRPGRLVEVGPATLAPGGAVSNVGLALATLGHAVRLRGRVGDDAFGRVLQDLLAARTRPEALAFDVAPGESTSYTVVVSPPGVDRLFLHHPGCNDRFDPADLDASALAGARLFYFGYPPLMARTWADGGEALAALFHRAKAAGLATALDLAMPDPASPAGRADWSALLERVLPGVDLFLPSFDEVLLMLDRPRFDAGAEPADDLLRGLTDRLLGFGCAVAGLKLGRRGLYVRTASAERLARLPGIDPAGWAGRTIHAPVFEVDVAGTTGAGDATVAGFLSAFLRGLDPEEAATMAVAVGACCVEAADATSGLRSWEATEARVAAGWARA